MDIRRTILWMIFTFSLLLLWNNWQEYNGQASLFSSGSAQQTQAAPNNTTQANDPSVPAGQAPQAAAPAALPGNSPASLAQGEMIEVTTDVYKLTFSTQGAQLVKAALLKYDSPDQPGEPQLLLDDSASSIYLAQSGVIGSRGEQWPNHLSPFSLVSSERTLQGDSLNVVFEAESNGLKVIKTYTLNKGRYDIHVHHDIQNISGEPIQPSLYLQLTRDGNDPPDSSRLYNTFTGPAVYSEEGRYQKISFSDIDKDKAKYEKTANNGWIGMVQHYFATAWVPVEGTQRTNQALKLGDNLYAIRSIEAVGSIDAGSSKTVNAQLWVGPQDQKAMAAVAPGLDLVVDYGWLTIISKPLFKILTWLHALLGNWGWSIVALTVLIKLVFFPLSAASYRSMAKMKKFTPRMQALREKFGDDKAKLNAAMMEMYRTEKINPLGGCLPMVVQIPVFIALYWVLLGSVEMRGAPWILWIHNLAAPDPWFILPAIMMGTMFLQIKLNPTPPDPMQARVMMLMPLVFGGMMFFFPAGLVLYWCVNNILSIGQQQYITRKLERQSSQAANS
ncbi:membrane protein insertase YidC [Alcaligenes endophyticus]|uniref:Membrane protein insertase YidC n=1 Tax=Alcaligenes endophyticus TaxID=1929088 RepID=A0ABT8EEY7_9BURK|nr:membrane protein insertase YidC [Alcaligenes endophyticus]MCX5590489.1 membrane protein insertase YidC [Alcaligenes endophyticus]MDN4119847.1 membrane protein insertase YidC [Alcaligenes endophyticus]